MNKQQWHPAGTRQSGAVAGGWSAAIPVPTVEGGDSGVGLRNMVGSQGGGVERKTTIWGRKTTYCRSITSDGTVEVTTDCDDPELLLLAHKGDVGYWSGNNWVKDYRTRQAWTASIAARMLREGHAAADDDDGVWVVMSAASSPQQRRSFQSTGRVAPHALTGIVAQISGLRLLQTMALADGWDTTLGGFRLPIGSALLLERCVTDAFRVYNMLPRPPWTDGVSWRAEQTAGYATDCAGGNVFIGADGDLLWRSWTETDHNGLSPLRAALATRFGVSRTNRKELAAAALHDPILQRQLTTGLFEGFDTTATGVINRNSLIKCNAMDVFYYALNSPAGERRFIPEEQSRLREFIDTIELLQP